jgi:hypothetical protein
MAWHAGLSILIFAAVGMNAQAPPRSVETAEADGAKYSKAADGAELAVFADAFGSRARRCVDAETHVMARSGEFVAGPFDTYVSLAGTGRRKVWWAPRDTATATMPPLQLRATKVGAPDVTVSWTLPSVVRNENGYFFNTLVLFPQNGKWLVVVSSGNNWGCFVLNEILAPK